MKKSGPIAVLFFCCQITAAYQTDPISSDLREVATSNFLTFTVDRNHSDSHIACYWIEHVQREISQINGGRRPELIMNNPGVVEKLEQAMAPIRKLEQDLIRCSREKNREEYRAIADELGAASRDPAIANRTFEILGKEHAIFMIKERLVDNLTRMERNQVGDWSTFGTVLQNANFLAFLNVTDSQKIQVERELSDSISHLADELTPLMRRLGSISHDRWNEILDVLADDQRAQARELLGKPVDWFRVPKTGKLQIDGDTWVSTYVTYCGTKMGKALKDKEISQYTKQELDEGGIELFSSVVYEMLYATALWDEYELVEDQKDRLTTTIRKHLNDNALVLPERPERIDNLLNQKAVYPETIKDLLLPSQLAWFRQIELQILLGRKYDSSVGLLNPRMAKFLDLGESQKQKIEKIAKDFEANAKRMLQEVKSQRAVAQKEFASRMMKILSKDQVSKLEASLGTNLGFIDE